MNSNLVFYTAAQRTKEFSQGQYIGTIDLLAEAEDQHRSIREIKTAAVDFYTSTAPALLDGVRSVDNTLTAILAKGEEANELLRHANATLDRIDESLIRIEEILGQGFELIAIRLDNSNQLLTAIRNILSAPVATQAAEYLSRAQGFITDGFYEEASHDLDKVTDLDPGNYVAWYLSGLLRSQAFGDKDGAFEAFAKSDRFSSVRSKEYYSKSQFQQALLSYNVDSDMIATEKHILQAIEADEGNLNAHFFAAELYSELGNRDASARHLRRCELIDEAFYFRSHSSSRLQGSGVHDRVFTDRTSELSKFNETFLTALMNRKALFEKLRDLGHKDPSFVSIPNDMKELNAAAPRNDYLAQRKIFRITESIMGSMPPKLGNIESWLKQWVATPGNDLERELRGIKRKEDKDFQSRLTKIAVTIAVIPALVWIVIAFNEVADSFDKGAGEGALSIIGVGIVTVIFGAIGVVVWGAITGIVALLLKGVGGASTYSKTNAVQRRSNEIAKSRNDVASGIRREIDGLKADLATSPS